MARPEQKVEDYLVERVEFLGGECQKLDVRGHRGRCDRIVLFPVPEALGVTWSCFVEVKAPGETAEPHQKREHARLLDRGFQVRVVDSKEGVDLLLSDFETD